SLVGRTLKSVRSAECGGQCLLWRNVFGKEGRGSCRAETAAIGDWRLATGETAVFVSSFPALPKDFCA
ncbi:hypothetical protein, partial [Fervidibacter sp.]